MSELDLDRLRSTVVETARRLQDDIVADRRALHRIPEVGMSLPETAGFVGARLDGLGIPWRTCGAVAPELTQRYEELGFPGITASTGIVATIGAGGPCILLRADMDALPIVEENDLPFCSQRDCSHMCGHDAHAAMLLAAARVLKEHEAELPGTVKLMFQPGEELGYGSQTMIDDGLLENPKVDAAFALHVIANAPAGGIVYTPGVTSASLDTIAVRVHGRGGHTSAPQQCIDPLMVVNQIYQAVNLFMTREIDPAASITLSVGTMGGGTVPNALPDTAELKLGMRSFDVEARAHALERLPEIIRAYTEAWRATCDIATFEVPCTVTDPALADELVDALRAVAGTERVTIDAPMPVTEDFAYVSRAVPSMFVQLGAGSVDAAPHHNPHMVLDESVLWMGAAMHAAAAVTWLANR